MSQLFYLTYKSIQNRKIAFLLSVISIAISVVLLLGVDKIVKSSKEHFINTIHETDVIVASSNGSLDILLNLIFHISDPLKEMDYKIYKDISTMKEVNWAVPLSLGDSFKSFDVVATNKEYFKRYKYSSGKLLVFSSGSGFSDFYDVILGANVAKKLNLKLNDTIHLSHGRDNYIHKNRDFKVVGILKKSLTPNDDSVFMQLKADEAMHIEWQSGHFIDMHISSESLSHMNIKPKHISGVIIGLKERSSILSFVDKIDNKGKNLKAVIPAKALSRLYKLMKNIQDIFMIISIAVFVAAVFTMLSTMFSTLNERRREIAIFRSLGASSKVVFLLFAIESFFIVVSGIVLGIIALDILFFILKFYVPFYILYGIDLYETFLLFIMVLISLLASLVPAVKSYKDSIKDGLTVKI